MRRRTGLALVSVAVVAVIAGLTVGKSGSGEEPAPKQPTAEEIDRVEARQNAREERGIDHVLGYSTFVQAGRGRKRQVALTFDDGPGPQTSAILRILRRTKTPATFFVVGSMIPGSEGTIRKIVRQGHVIGNHTQDHSPMGDLGVAEQITQLSEQTALMEGVGGPEQRLFRPPYRSFDGSTIEMLAERDLLMVLWSVDTGDYEGIDAGEIVKRALADVEPGSIILMHDGGGNRSESVKALPGIIKGLERRKLKPVTVPRLVLDDPPADGYPLPDGLSGASG